MPRVLVTGGAGFIGSHVADYLVDDGHDVTILDDLSGGSRENASARARFVAGSILDRALLERLFREHAFEYVFHLAAYAAEVLSHFIRHYNYQNNVIGSVNLINLAVRHRVRCFVFTSSIAVYGTGRTPLCEDTPARPEDPYGIAKLAVEQDLRAAQRSFGLDSIVFRPHNVYGARQNIGDRYRNVVGIFMNQCLKGRPMTLFGSGEQRRAFSYIDDVAPCIARSIDVPEAYNETFNLGSDLPLSVNELAHAVAEVMGVPARLVHLPPRQEVAEVWADHAKARRVLDLADPVPLGEGLRRMADWVKAHGPRETGRFARIEIEEGLPEAWRQR